MEPSREADDDLRPEYDLGQLRGGVRGKYAGRKRGMDRSADGYQQTSGGASEKPNGKLTGTEIKAFLDRVVAEMKPQLEACVVPIAAHKGGAAEQYGTGTLFRVADVSFLVTASHVLEKAREQGKGLAISDSAPRSPSVPLYGRAQGHSHLDVLVWELPPDTVAALPNRRFLTVHHADRANRRPAKGTYLICGYPSSLARWDTDQGNLSLKPLTTLSGRYEGGVMWMQEGHDPDAHLLLDTSPDGAELLDCPDGVTPAVNGMSGASIWQVYYEGLSSRHWTPNDASVVAVQTGVYRKGAITRGTRWWVVDQIIRANYPDLAAPLSLLTPTR